jgi:hypothetical protein
MRRARDHIQAGDLVVIVGTMGELTPLDEREKILGLMEPTKQIVRSLDYFLSLAPQDLDENGNFRWLFALELRAAWQFLEPRMAFSTVCTRTFGRVSGLRRQQREPA